jgi:class 3 adenylate cyclase
MNTLRATAIVKTDISGSTARFRALPESDLAALLAEHRELVTRLSAVHGGHIVKPEGDGFWVAFPSVTAAALAAMAIQEEVRLAEIGKGDRRLVMRIVITLGDVLHQDGALVGDAVVLAARIEALTPPDEIYLSAAACLAVNQAEVRAALVDTFTLKGFPGAVPVYRIEQTHRTRVIAEQYLLIADLGRFSALIEAGSLGDVERVLDRLREVVGDVCLEFEGTNRLSAGDAYTLTFASAAHAVAAAARLVERWCAPGRSEAARCPMNVAVHKGALFAYRDFFYSPDLNTAGVVQRAASRSSRGDSVVFVTGQVRRDLAGTVWDELLQRTPVDPTLARIADMELYRLGGMTGTR